MKTMIAVSGKCDEYKTGMCRIGRDGWRSALATLLYGQRIPLWEKHLICSLDEVGGRQFEVRRLNALWIEGAAVLSPQA